jgi:hypothetical protein
MVATLQPMPSVSVSSQHSDAATGRHLWKIESARNQPGNPFALHHKNDNGLAIPPIRPSD